MIIWIYVSPINLLVNTKSTAIKIFVQWNEFSKNNFWSFFLRSKYLSNEIGCHKSNELQTTSNDLEISSLNHPFRKKERNTGWGIETETYKEAYRNEDSLQDQEKKDKDRKTEREREREWWKGNLAKRNRLETSCTTFAHLNLHFILCEDGFEPGSRVACDSRAFRPLDYWHSPCHVSNLIK